MEASDAGTWREKASQHGLFFVRAVNVDVEQVENFRIGEQVLLSALRTKRIPSR